MRAQSLLTLVKNMRRSKGPIGTAWPQLHTQNCPTLSQIVCPPHLHLPLPLTLPPPCFVEPSTVSFTFLIFPLAICVQQLSGDPWFYAGIYNSVHSGYIFSVFVFFPSGVGGGVGVIGPGDSRHFSRVTSGVRFCVWAVLCGHAPLPKRFCVWAAFCGAILLTSMLVGCLWGPPSAPPPPAHAFSWGGGRFMG
jgi:hypothetical protein